MGNEDLKVVSDDLDPTISLEDVKSVSSDDALLMSMGKKPELKRVYNFWTRKWNLSQLGSIRRRGFLRANDVSSVCAYQIMISCSWSCLVVLYSTIFDVGGPFCLIWGT